VKRVRRNPEPSTEAGPDRRKPNGVGNCRQAAKGWIRPFEPYREVHEQNLKLVHDYWKEKTLPEVAP